MKKQYAAPMTEQINIQTEGVVADSLQIHKNSEGGNTQLSQKRGWSSDLWNGEEEE